MVESDLFSSERVPTWVGCSRGCGGARSVNLGSQSMELAVVSWLAMSSDEAVVERVARGREPSCEGGRDCAVVTNLVERKQEPFIQVPVALFSNNLL